MNSNSETLELIEKVDEELYEAINEDLEMQIVAEAFGALELDPDPDEDILIPGTDEKIG